MGSLVQAHPEAQEPDSLSGSFFVWGEKVAYLIAVGLIILVGFIMGDD